MWRGHLGIPPASAFLKPEFILQPYTPLDNSSLPRKRITTAVHGSFKPLQRLTHETAHTLSPLIKTGSLPCGGLSCLQTIKTHAMRDTPYSFNRLMEIFTAFCLAARSRRLSERDAFTSYLQYTFCSVQRPAVSELVPEKLLCHTSFRLSSVQHNVLIAEGALLCGG